MVYAVLRRAWRMPFTLQSNFARNNTAFVAMAACKGLITTKIKGNQYGHLWRITRTGLQMLNESEV